MAVPKNELRDLKNSRKANWLKKADAQAKAYSLANSVLNGNSTSFVYSLNTDETEE